MQLYLFPIYLNYCGLNESDIEGDRYLAFGDSVMSGKTILLFVTIVTIRAMVLGMGWVLLHSAIASNVSSGIICKEGRGREVITSGDYIDQLATIKEISVWNCLYLFMNNVHCEKQIRFEMQNSSQGLYLEYDYTVYLDCQHLELPQHLGGSWPNLASTQHNPWEDTQHCLLVQGQDGLTTTGGLYWSRLKLATHLTPILWRCKIIVFT